MRSHITCAQGDPTVLTPAALEFVAALDAAFAARRVELLGMRGRRRARLASGAELTFLPQTASIRADDSWRVAGAAPGLVDRRVEITGPPERRMTVNALNSGAKVWLADFEDATSPTWDNIVSGQRNLREAIDGTLDFSIGDKHYAVGPQPATIVVRPRGWHLVEKHILVDGRPVPAALVDAGLYLFHCARRQLDRGSGPYFYLPKLESHLEARLWNDVFLLAQSLLGIPRGTIRATVLIETITAAVEMEEILYELREHCAGLNAGRWDYLFSMIKTFGARPWFSLPDRAAVGMAVPFLRAYTQLLVDTCHRRGAYAIGGMAAFIPSRDASANAVALAKVREDKAREAADGFDGSWVAHPGLVETCRAVFDGHLGTRPNQLHRRRSETSVDVPDLLNVASAGGSVTENGVRANIAVALRYFDAWLRGNGAAAIFGLMEDAATAEISRCQLWQWIRSAATLADGRTVDSDLVEKLLAEELSALRAEPDAADHRWDDAETILRRTALADTLPDFFTTTAYAEFLAEGR